MKGKALVVKHLIGRVRTKVRNIRGWNIKINRETQLISDDALEAELGERILKVDRKTEEFWEWVRNSDLREFQNYSYPHKKALEFFFSAHLLEIKEGDIVLDIAGGRSNYLFAVKKTFRPSKLILQDHIYNGITERDGILIIGGSASKVTLSDMSVDKIACHHAFEHFQQDVDFLFIKELSRLLNTRGKAVIIPLFIAKEYIECWNIQKNSKFNKNAKLIVDKTASLPGVDEDGHFARIYSPSILYSRILTLAEKVGLNWSIFTCTLDGKFLPDMNVNFGAEINYPLRALVLVKGTCTC